jgi:hypothetical protein
MPMPPPRASTEDRDPHVAHELGQLLRALHEEGPQAPEALAELVGARFWGPGRFEAAVAHAAADGLLLRDDRGRLQTA